MMNFRYSKVNFFLKYSGESNRFKWLMFKGLRVKVTAWLAWIKQLWLVHFDEMFPSLLGGNLLRGVLREKICTRASFTKILTNYTSEESLITAHCDKNIIEATSLLTKCQETVSGSPIEFIGYRMPQHEQNGCTISFTRHKSTTVCQAFSIFWWVV